ncbi:MAG: cytochrome-c oxidase, cbb3-type subunit III [Xanthomonadales bacterium]|nr:cytochrome-c oxidase, cbb3-type subunit III [Gammaproteobacteria bacterium]MBT8052765.1 cytochrome-c oxidase, cbb3-type subunit III [Gammaproteobacteria bacterium]NND56172.1 cytochrome-c oxidase, cbb3-type subunit III [Xanthomonadales bacterium]NNK50577.1 cytochrome-c oxidase, cbb3-type subunit III [Xanthomonadales bacterium]
MLNSFWNWFVIIISVASILACWWLLHWTKGVSDRSGDEAGSTGHVWDDNITELNTPLPRWWLHLFNITIVFALVYLAIFPGLGNFGGFLGWTQVGQYEEEVARATTAQEAIFSRFRDMDAAALMADQEARATGGRLFGNNCAMCHGSDGRGAKSFPNLADNDWQWGGSFEQILSTLEYGRQAAMPPLAAVLGEQGVPEVVAYVQQLSGQKADAEMAAAGQARFQMVCMACHGMDGKGNQALGAPNLTDDIWLYSSAPSDIEYGIRNGRNGKMPAFGNTLSEDHRRLLAAYVMGLSN